MTTRKPRASQPKTDVPLPQRHVNMSNALARASHSLSLAEKRVIACGLGNTDSKSAYLYNQAIANGGWIVRLAALEFASWAKIEPHTAYEQLKAVAETLIKKQWTIIEQTARGPVVTRYNWLSRIKYQDGEGWVELEFTHHTAQHLLALRSRYTSYRLEQAGALRSSYSWRLLECLESWKTKGTWTPTIDEFCHAMDVAENYRKDFGDIRRRVIEPAVIELREKDRYLIDWKPVKAGRKVTGLRFEFSRQTQASLF